MSEGTKVNIQLLPDQFVCLEEHGCFIKRLDAADSIPVGHPVTVTFGNDEREVAVVAQQIIPESNEHYYVFALSSQVELVED